MKNQGHTSRARRRSRRAFLQTLGGAAAAFSLSSRATAAEEPKLNFYNWDTYIGENTLADFKAATGIDVNLDLFGDNDELFAKIRGGNPGYDVIVPTNDYVERMWRAGLLVKLDHARIPNFRKNIAPDFQDGDFDPGRLYSMPYMWGTMGIAYRKSKVEKPTSWSSVWGPESDQHKGRIAWISESDAMLGMAMKSLGHSYNSNEEAHITAAADLLAKYKKNILTIAEDNGQDLLAAGDVDLAVEWNGDIAQLNSEDPDVAYVIPREGSYYWQDCLAIPTGAAHPENAHAFMNFLLDAEVGRDLAEFIEYATPNEAARKLANESYRENSVIFPTPEALKTLEPQLYRGEAAYEIFEREWTRMLAA